MYEPMGYLHSLETMGLVDGPGIRTIFFLQGCPLRCLYCHNPDTQEIDCLISDKAAHDHGVRSRLDDHIEIGAAVVITVEDVVRIACRYRSYYGKRGGVTISGGEPLMQAPFVLACFKALHDAGITTCLDTSGYAVREENVATVPALLQEADTILLDIKGFRPDGWLRIAQREMDPYERFVGQLKAYGGKIWLRHVMVPGYTDSREAMEELCEWLAAHPWLLAPLDRIQILPYHTAGIEKYRELGRPYLLEGVEAMDRAKAHHWEDLLMAALKRWKAEGRFDGRLEVESA